VLRTCRDVPFAYPLDGPQTAGVNPLSFVGSAWLNRGGSVGWGRPRTHHWAMLLIGIAWREAGESLVDIGRSYNVSRSTISRLKPRQLSECGELRAAWLSCRRRTRYPDQRIHQHG
jgi:hypothetical protein